MSYYNTFLPLITWQINQSGGPPGSSWPPLRGPGCAGLRSFPERQHPLRDAEMSLFTQKARSENGNYSAGHQPAPGLFAPQHPARPRQRRRRSQAVAEVPWSRARHHRACKNDPTTPAHTEYISLLVPHRSHTSTRHGGEGSSGSPRTPAARLCPCAPRRPAAGGLDGDPVGRTADRDRLPALGTSGHQLTSFG